MNNTILTDNKEIETLGPPPHGGATTSLRGDVNQDRVQGAPSAVRS